jgi:hypothetical protein
MDAALPVLTSLLGDANGKVLGMDPSENSQRNSGYVLAALREHLDPRPSNPIARSRPVPGSGTAMLASRKPTNGAS